MIITIGIGLIATLLVLANYKALRNPKILGLALVMSTALMVTGISLILHTKGEKTFYAAFLSPFLAILLLLLSRIIYRRRFGSEIIMYMYGIYPIRHEERFVTRLEKTITFFVTALSVAIPILVTRLFF
jgi:hypothetical protein